MELSFPNCCCIVVFFNVNAKMLAQSVGLVIFTSRTHRPQHRVILMAKIYDTHKKKNQHREKSRGSRNKENEAQVYQSSFPVESHRICLIPPASNCDKPCEASWRLHTQGFRWRRVTQGPSTLHVSKRQTPERKAGVGINHIICTNSLGIVNHAIG